MLLLTEVVLFGGLLFVLAGVYHRGTFRSIAKLMYFDLSYSCLALLEGKQKHMYTFLITINVVLIIMAVLESNPFI